MSIIDVSPPRRRLRPWVTLTLALATAVLGGVSLAMTIASWHQQLDAPQKIIICGRTYTAQPGEVLDIASFGPHCTAVVTGG